MSEKTITLSGAEVEVAFSGANAWLRNDGTGTIYAGKAAGVSAGADGVVAVPAGGSAPVYGANGQVFLLGTGSVQLIGSDYSANPFKTSAQSGGSGADEVARAAIEAHAGNSEIHVTATDKVAWNGKAELADIPDKLPADGGNADTVDNKHASEFMQFLGDFRSGSIRDIVLPLNTSGFLYCGGAGVTDLPADGGYWVVQVRVYGIVRELIATRISLGMSYACHYNGSEWYNWHNLADGGNAASVGAYTESAIAALEARIAALEGK